MKRVSFAKASAVFSLGGFVTRVLPVALSGAAAFAALLWFLTDWKNSDIGVVGVFVVPFVVWFVPRMIRFMVARDAHLEFEEKYGERYRDLVETGEVRLGAIYILFARSPEMYAKLLEARRTG